MLTDAHCHITFKDYAPEETALILARAREAGVGLFINVGAGDGVEGNKLALDLALEHSDVYATVGLHPHDASLSNGESLAKIRQWALHPKVVAVGEIGLDFYYEHSPRAKQEEALPLFVELAREIDKPIMIHDRGADDRTYEILKSFNLPPNKIMIHCFTGTKELAEKYLSMGCLLSFTGIITFKKSEALREVVGLTPLDSLLVETDSPYLTPEPHRGKKNEPAYVALVAKKVAEIKGISFEEVAQTTTDNAKKFFKI